MIIPISKGCIKDVIFGGKNFKVMFLSSMFFGCAAQLSIRRSMEYEPRFCLQFLIQFTQPVQKYG